MDFERERQALLETKIDGERIYDGRVLALEVDRVRLSNGESAVREVVRHGGAVAVLPLLPNRNVIVEEQFRYAHERILLEIPAGKLEAGDQDPESAALRELEEETGYRAGRLIPLGEFIPSPAIFSEKIFLYLALDLTPGEVHRDDDEFLLVRELPLSRLVEMALAGELPDGKTQAAVLRAHLMLQHGMI